MTYENKMIRDGLNECIFDSHQAALNCGWYTDLKSGLPKQMNDGERLMLMVSELVEGFEGIRKGLMDDKLPTRPMIEVELADCLIRIFDFAGAKGLDLAGAYLEKRAFNDQRADHKIENRQKEGGKKF